MAKKFLRAALVMVAEDFHLRVPPMPARLGRGRSRPKKAILTPEQVGLLLEAALKDERKGIYYAFPFLTGVRPSEQLALLWEDVDLAAGVIRIRRMQEQDGYDHRVHQDGGRDARHSHVAAAQGHAAEMELDLPSRQRLAASGLPHAGQHP